MILKKVFMAFSVRPFLDWDLLAWEYLCLFLVHREFPTIWTFPFKVDVLAYREYEAVPSSPQLYYQSQKQVFAREETASEFLVKPLSANLQ